jgi:hypothetical protein
MRNFTLATSIATLLLAGASSPAFARGGKKESDTAVPASINQQFEWENKVVGPKEGLDQKKVAATREQGIREEEERKKQVPVKQKKVVADPATATLPTMDIEKPAAPTEKKQKKVAAAQAPRQKDALDNLLDEQGVKPNRPTGGSTGLDAVFASDGDSKGKKAAKKTRRGRN